MPDPAVSQVFCIDHKNKQDNRERNVGVINGRMGELFGQEINGKQGSNRQTNVKGEVVALRDRQIRQD